jgi:hypothetical protein
VERGGVNTVYHMRRVLLRCALPSAVRVT